MREDLLQKLDQAGVKQELTQNVRAKCNQFFRDLLFGKDVVSIMIRNILTEDYHEVVLDTAQETIDGYRKAFIKRNTDSESVRTETDVVRDEGTDEGGTK